MAGLAAVTLSSKVQEARSDYEDLEGLEVMSLETLQHRRSTYAGVKREIRGRASLHACITHVKGHGSVEDNSSTEEHFNALGNDAADHHAKQATEKVAKPSDRELQDWHREVEFLKLFFLFVPGAFSLWPAAVAILAQAHSGSSDSE